MITGFNTDVEYDGRVFHVQTEDKGRDNPVVESLVYTAGEIVSARRTSYADLVGTPDCTEEQILKRMETQHQALVREIRNGKFDPEGPKPFGYNIITNRSLDDVVLDFLSREAGLERIRLEEESHPVLLEGSQGRVKLRVLSEASDQPVAGARVRVKLVTTRERPRELFSGRTAQDGGVEASFDIPRLDGAEAAILYQAEAAGNNAEIKRLVRKVEES